MKQYLIDITALADRVLGWGLLGALCGYLVLFGPLVSIPLVLGAQGASALTAGLVLTALPARFAFADIGAGAILPTWLSERRRATLGAVICTGGLGAMLLTPPIPSALLPLLAVVGVGLGVFTPSNTP